MIETQSASSRNDPIVALLRAESRLGSRAVVARCVERVSLAPEGRPTASSINHLSVPTADSKQALIRVVEILYRHVTLRPRTHSGQGQKGADR